MSSTSADLLRHREAVKEAILAEHWDPVMMEYFGTGVLPTIEECRRKVLECHLVVLLVAYRRGWVPRRAEGGNGRHSITAYELKAAREMSIPVRVLMAGKTWPGELCETDPKAREQVLRFRADLNQVAQFFEVESFDPGSREPIPGPGFRVLARQLLLDHRDWLRTTSPEPLAAEPGNPLVGAQVVLPTLEPLLADVTPARSVLARLYREAAPAGWDPLPLEGNPRTLLCRCLRSLARAPRQRGKGTFPLLRFVSLLAGHLESAVASSLQTWLDAAVVRLGTGPADSRQMRQESAAAVATPTPASEWTLLVQIEPRQCSTKYGLKTWLFENAEAACLRSGEDTCAREEIPAFLDELLLELARRGRDLERLRIELLLPRELLCAAVDQWQVTPPLGLDPVPVGAEHPVTVRSLERARHPKAASALESRWQTLLGRADVPLSVTDAEGLTTATTAAAVWIDREDRGGNRLRFLLADARQLVGAVLGHCPRPLPADSSSDVLNTLLAAGIPVVLWARQCQANDFQGLRSALAELLCGKPLRQLPHCVRDLRRQALWAGDDDHLGRHATLVWDDPTRPPPDRNPAQRLRAPWKAR